MKNINPKTVFFGLLTIIFILFVLHLVSYYTYYISGNEGHERFFFKTNFDKEKTAPAIFSSLILFCSSVILAIIGFGRLKIKKEKQFWLSLSFIFLFVALDELLRIHEKLGTLISSQTHTSGIFYYSWIIPYGIAVIVLGFLIFKPLFQLPKHVRNGFIISAILFLAGAVGMEMFTGWYITYNGLENERLVIMPQIFVFYTIEELLEMIGVSYFIYVLLQFYKDYQLKRPQTGLNFIK